MLAKIENAPPGTETFARVASVPAEGRSEQQLSMPFYLTEFMLKPALCGVCASRESLYIIAGGLGQLCESCLAFAVSAACDLWPGVVSYSRELEAVIYG